MVAEPRVGPRGSGVFREKGLVSPGNRSPHAGKRPAGGRLTRNQRAMAHDVAGNPGIDARISVLGGESLKDYTRYKRSVEASILACEKEDEKKALGPKLYKLSLIHI